MFSFRKLCEVVYLLFFSIAFAAAAPNLSGVYNAASWVPAGLPNSGIAQGSMFVLTGSGLGPAALQEVTSYPLPTSQGLAGTTIQVASGGSTAYCIMIYTSATQVAAILPSATPAGSGALTLSYQGAQASIPVQIVKSSFGIFGINEQGSGPGIVTDGNYQIRIPTAAAHPGDVLIIWGTGLGPIAASETVAPPQQDLGSGVQVFVGGQAASVLYGGRGSSAGLDQINFVVPNGLSGCYLSLVVKVGGVVSNFASIPVAAAGESICSDTNGLSAAELTQVANGGAIDTARLDLDTVGGDNASALFEQWNFANLIMSHGLAGGPSVGSCEVYVVPSGNGVVVTDPFAVPGLDAGTQLTVSGPNGTKTIPLSAPGAYKTQLSAKGQTPYLTPGTYTLSNGSGGKDIGPFSATVVMPQPLVWTNESSTKSVSASQNLTITWSGGGPNDAVSIIGITGLASIHMDTEFLCTARAAAGQFTIPSQVFALLPPAGVESNGSPGIDFILGLVSPVTFSAPHLDYGLLFVNTTVATILSIN